MKLLYVTHAMRGAENGASTKPGFSFYSILISFVWNQNKFNTVLAFMVR